jgi:ubiquinone/menaquinone biosynthesis C-methylase UbiE
VKAYYHARAGEYDDWWLARNLHAGAPDDWTAERDGMLAAVAALDPRRTLDVACGTGFVTRHLPGEVVGLDASPAMVAIARRRLPDATFVVGDALELPFPDGSFERVFASYFYCHLEPPARGRFVAEARRVAPELVVVASRPGAGDPHERLEERVLRDGSRWHVFKRVFEPERLAAELAGRVVHASRLFVVVQSP